MQNWLPKLLDTNANFEMIVFGVLLILMLQYARNGLWPILANWWDGPPAPTARAATLAPPARARRRASVLAGQVVLEVDAIRRNSAAWWRSSDIS